MHEVLHSVKISRNPRMLIKLDIAKAYDKLNWEFMENMLGAYGFSPDWVEWVMGLVSLPFFNILLNGSPTSTFQPSRGIHQGDPFSPFLFILMVEGLSHLIAAQVDSGAIRAVKAHEGASSQTHQQFVDDTMLMGHPSVQEARSFKRCLTLFAKASASQSIPISPKKNF